MNSGLTIAEAANRVGLSPHTLRYYERAGLLEPPSRTEGGLRRYLPEDLEVLRFLHRLRLTGMSIRQIREFTALARQGKSTLTQRKKILELHRISIREQVQSLELNLKIVDLKIELYDQGWVFGDSDENDCARKLHELLRQSSSDPTRKTTHH